MAKFAGHQPPPIHCPDCGQDFVPVGLEYDSANSQILSFGRCPGCGNPFVDIYAIEDQLVMNEADYFERCDRNRIEYTQPNTIPNKIDVSRETPERGGN